VAQAAPCRIHAHLNPLWQMYTGAVLIPKKINLIQNIIIFNARKSGKLNNVSLYVIFCILHFLMNFYINNCSIYLHINFI